jgi:hypothetical protein
MGAGASRLATARRASLAVLVIALLPVSSALGATGYGTVKVRVRPAVGLKRTPFVVSFTAQRTGFVPSSWSGYRVVASGRASRRCVSEVAVTVPATLPNQHVRVTLRPSGRSRVWCKGTYRGRLEEMVRPSCGFREMCPLARQPIPTFIGFRTVGRFGFRVR